MQELFTNCTYGSTQEPQGSRDHPATTLKNNRITPPSSQSHLIPRNDDNKKKEPFYKLQNKKENSIKRLWRYTPLKEKKDIRREDSKNKSVTQFGEIRTLKGEKKVCTIFLKNQ